MDCWSVIGMCIPVLRIPCSFVMLDIRIMKSFFGAFFCVYLVLITKYAR